MHDIDTIDVKKIKLIIWDLDDTFWHGTLSEGKINLIPQNVRFLDLLISKGIVSSICSKNDFELVKKVLNEARIWEKFVFPSIDWTNKGNRIKEMISDMGLRSQNVLFIDDNEMNLNEVKFYVADIMTLHAQYISELQKMVSKIIYNGDGQKRLEQYHTLEIKRQERTKCSSNEAFLNQSCIDVFFESNCLQHINRIEELVQRTNQLNYTKRRWKKDELFEILQKKGYQSACIFVKDRYGDYGLAGFYTLDLAANELVHFLFSCRTLGMGVEQYVYQQLKYPILNIVGDVSVILEKKPIVYWINSKENVVNNSANYANFSSKVLIKGPCDMEAIIPFINGAGNVNTEFNFVNEKGVSITGFNHSSHIIEGQTLSEEQINDVLTDAQFLDVADFKTNMFSGEYDVIVWSMLPDEHQGVYIHKKTGIKITFSSGNNDLTDPANWDKFISGEYTNHNFKFTREFLTKFTEKFEFEGFLSTNEIVENVKRIRNMLSNNTMLILMLGSEIECDNFDVNFRDHAVRHKEVNAALKEAFKNRDNVKFIEFTEFIESQKDYGSCINHFSKRVYHDIAEKVVAVINENSNNTRISLFSSTQMLVNKAHKKIHAVFNKLMKDRNNV